MTYDNNKIYVVSLGTLCLPMFFSKALEEAKTAVRIKGPIDNTIIDSQYSPESIVEPVLKNEYTLVTEPIKNKIFHCFEIEPGICAKFFYNNYHFQIIHNDPRTQKYKDEFFKRYLIWKDAISTPRDNVFYLLYSHEKDDYLKFFPETIYDKIITIGEKEFDVDIIYTYEMDQTMDLQEKADYCSKEFKRVLYSRGFVKS